MKKKSIPKILLILSLLLAIVIPLMFTLQSFASDNTIEDKNTIFDSEDELLKEVDSAIGDFVKSKDTGFLILAEGFNSIAFEKINAWAKREAGKVSSKDTEHALKAIEVIEMVRDSFYKRICKNYNKIATHFEEIKRFDEAKRLYKTVIREFDPNEFANCFKEAEISLMNLSNK